MKEIDHEKRNCIVYITQDSTRLSHFSTDTMYVTNRNTRYSSRTWLPSISIPQYTVYAISNKNNTQITKLKFTHVTKKLRMRIQIGSRK